MCVSGTHTAEVVYPINDTLMTGVQRDYWWVSFSVGTELPNLKRQKTENELKWKF